MLSFEIRSEIKFWLIDWLIDCSGEIAIFVDVMCLQEELFRPKNYRIYVSDRERAFLPSLWICFCVNVLDLAYRRPFVGWSSFEVWVINFCRSNVCSLTENPNAVLANRKIRCIYAVLANKIICIYLCSCVFMSRFGRNLNPIRDGWQCWLSTQATHQMRLLVWRVVNI